MERALDIAAEMLPFLAIGFAAQIVDGAVGMAFGQVCSALLIGMGVPPALASAGIHTAEMFTTAISGISHVAHGNIDWKLFVRIVIPGVIGGLVGALLVTRIDAEVARPIVLTYLGAMGLYLLWRGATHHHTEREPRFVAPLGLVGGFLDAAGGGGWGAVVTTNLLVQGTSPREAVGTANAAEFFLTVTISATFAVALGWEMFTIATIGLVLGGGAAAPLGALVAKRVDADLLLTFVGFAVTASSLLGLYHALT